MKEHESAFPYAENMPRKPYITDSTWTLIKERQQLKHDIEKGQLAEEQQEGAEATLKRISKDIKKKTRKDRETYMAEWVEDHLDPREQWAGLRKIKTGYTTKTYDRKDRHGTRILHKEQAEATADYLENGQWGTLQHEDILTAEISDDWITQEEPECRTECITEEELDSNIAQLKNNKAPGPGSIKTEIYKDVKTKQVKKWHQKWIRDLAWLRRF